MLFSGFSVYFFVACLRCILLSIHFLSILAMLFLCALFVFFPCTFVLLPCISFHVFDVSFSSSILFLSSAWYYLTLIVSIFVHLVLCCLSFIMMVTFCYVVFNVLAALCCVIFNDSVLLCVWPFNISVCILVFSFCIFVLLAVQFENHILYFLVLPLSDLLFPHLL